MTTTTTINATLETHAITQAEKHEIAKKDAAIIDFEKRFPSATIKSIHQFPGKIRFDFEVPGLKRPVWWISEGNLALVKAVDEKAWNRYRKLHCLDPH